MRAMKVNNDHYIFSHKTSDRYDCYWHFIPESNYIDKTSFYISRNNLYKNYLKTGNFGLDDRYFTIY